MVINKALLVAQGYTQVEVLDFEETFSPITRLEFIRLLLSVACLPKFNIFQMNVNSIFLNGFIHEEVYVAQPKGFENPHFPNHVYKLKKALYGLKQAPRALYKRLTSYLLKEGYQREGADKTFFIKKFADGMLCAQIYVDDIIFGSTSAHKADAFVHLMQYEFEMSMVGELN